MIYRKNSVADELYRYVYIFTFYLISTYINTIFVNLLIHSLLLTLYDIIWYIYIYIFMTCKRKNNNLIL